MLGAGRERGHRSGAARRGPVPGTPSPALSWCEVPARRHCLPWAGSRPLTPQLLFLVKYSPEGRRRGAEVFALSVSTQLSRVTSCSRHGEGRAV